MANTRVTTLPSYSRDEARRLLDAIGNIPESAPLVAAIESSIAAIETTDDSVAKIIFTIES